MIADRTRSQVAGHMGCRIKQILRSGKSRPTAQVSSSSSNFLQRFRFVGSDGLLTAGQISELNLLRALPLYKDHLGIESGEIDKLVKLSRTLATDIEIR